MLLYKQIGLLLLLFLTTTTAQQQQNVCIQNLTTIGNNEANLTTLEEARLYILCPNTTFVISPQNNNFPIVLRHNSRVQCGNLGSSNNSCILDTVGDAIFINPILLFNDTNSMNITFQGLTIINGGGILLQNIPWQSQIEFIDIIYTNTTTSTTFFQITAEEEEGTTTQVARSIPSENNNQDTTTREEEEEEEEGRRNLQQQSSSLPVNLIIRDSLFQNNRGTTTNSIIATLINISGFISVTIENTIFENNDFSFNNTLVTTTTQPPIASNLITFDSTGQFNLINNCFIDNRAADFGLIYVVRQQQNIIILQNNFVHPPLINQCPFVAFIQPPTTEPLSFFVLDQCGPEATANQCMITRTTSTPIPTPSSIMINSTIESFLNNGLDPNLIISWWPRLLNATDGLYEFINNNNITLIVPTDQALLFGNNATMTTSLDSNYLTLLSTNEWTPHRQCLLGSYIIVENVINTTTQSTMFTTLSNAELIITSSTSSSSSSSLLLSVNNIPINRTITTTNDVIIILSERSISVPCIHFNFINVGMSIPEADDLSFFFNALLATQLDFTEIGLSILVPTNRAFQNLVTQNNILIQNITLLKQTLLRHFIITTTTNNETTIPRPIYLFNSSNVGIFTTLSEQDTTTTNQSTTIQIEYLESLRTNNDDEDFASGFTITAAGTTNNNGRILVSNRLRNILCQNGVIHVINQVLIPQELLMIQRQQQQQPTTESPSSFIQTTTSSGFKITMSIMLIVVPVLLLL